MNSKLSNCDTRQISVIVPIYKVEKYLKKCVDSILCQSYSNLEIILVDDGSPDGCADICDEYATNDDRIRVIHKNNGGLSSARNAGLDVANGELICFVDSDDYIELDMMDKMKKRMDKDFSDIVVCSTRGVDESNIITFESKWNKDDCFNQDAFWSNLYTNSMGLGTTAWGKLYKKELFAEVRFDEGKLHEDEYILHKIIDQCSKISVMEDVFYNYLERTGSITNVQYSQKNYDKIYALIDRTHYFNKTNRYDMAAKTCSHIMIQYMIIYNNLEKNSINDEVTSNVKDEINILLKEVNSVSFSLKRFFYIQFFELYNNIWKVKNRIGE